MNKILSIASSFYQLNTIKINSDKSTLMVINSSENDNETNAMFNNIPIHSTPTNTPVRILGVWFNTSGKITYMQLKQLQSALWIPFCPLLMTQALPTKFNNKNITAVCVTLMISFHISCQPSSSSLLTSKNNYFHVIAQTFSQ
nr:1521_t:CDS:2 [Entrophospora candida]